MMEHPCPLYTCKQSLLTKALSVRAHGPGGTWGGDPAACTRSVRALSEKSPRGNVELGDESLPATRLHCWRAEKRVVREKVKESCRDELSLATYQQAKTRAEGLQEQQRGE